MPTSYIDKLISYAKENDASDIIITSSPNKSRQKSETVLKIHGKVQNIENIESISTELCEKSLLALMNNEQKEAFKTQHQIDFAYENPKGIRVRCNIHKQLYSYGAVFRLISEQIKSADDLSLPSQLKLVSNLKNGLVLVTGSMGSGKSTTLAALINEINLHQQKHILTIEDPIEMIYKSHKSIINQREVGTHTSTFNSALKSALRENVDVILVGELRDYESMKLALTASDVGSIVLSTLHTNSAVESINRIINIYPPEQQNEVRYVLADNLRYIVWQQLIPSVYPSCPRVLACEILISNPAIQNAIRSGQNFLINHAMETGAKDGMVTMSQYLDFLLNKGDITEETYHKYKPFRVKNDK